MTKVLSDKVQLEDSIKQILSSLPPAEHKRAEELVSELRGVGPTRQVKEEFLKILPQQKVDELVMCVQAIEDLLTPSRGT